MRYAKSPRLRIVRASSTDLIKINIGTSYFCDIPRIEQFLISLEQPQSIKMKYFLTILMLITISFSQAQVKKNDGTPNDITQKEQPYESAIYQLFPTQNMWTFIKLNTRNGQMWQVQWSIDAEKRLILPIE
jgi:hypothetical protein